MTQRQLAADLTTTCGGWAVEMAIFGNSNGHIGDEEEWEDIAERIVRISVEWRLLAAADQTPALLRERMDALIAAASEAALAVMNIAGEEVSSLHLCRWSRLEVCSTRSTRRYVAPFRPPTSSTSLYGLNNTICHQRWPRRRAFVVGHSPDLDHVFPFSNWLCAEAIEVEGK
uniref:Uncharacterized protein n=1 Tax=Globodera rostochiensis TaxID=31243 RepID=A0A914HB52_GLORO